MKHNSLLGAKPISSLPDGSSNLAMNGVLSQASEKRFRRPQKNALCVAVNYVGKHCWLEGPVSDHSQWARLLSGVGEFDSVKVLTDKFADGVPLEIPNKLPTKKNILAGLSWLLEDSVAGDILMFTFSGCGTQVPDFDCPGFVEVQFCLSITIPSTLTEPQT